MDANFSLIDDLSRLRTEDAMSRVVSEVRAGRFGVNDIRQLAAATGRSGATLEIAGGDLTADLASTGGPGSLSTLLAPLYLRSYGLLVPKLGVPGRPAGGIDVLAQLPGYRSSLLPSDVREVLLKCGYAHFLAGEIFAPLDAALFKYRQMVGAQDVPPLAVASLLAKKIACGVKFAGLDVRVAPHGNFGGTFDEARRAARLFCATAAAVKIEAVAILTDARTPYQPFLGRGEALLAMKLIFEGRADAWLAEHNDRCRLMAANVATVALKTKFTAGDGDIRRIFLDNVVAQGSSMDAFDAKVDSIAKARRRELIAPREGFLNLDVAAIRSAFVAAHAGVGPHCMFPDEIGIILHAKSGAYVKRGDLLASVRSAGTLWPIMGGRLTDAFQVVDVLNYAPGLEEIVRA